MSAKQLLNQDTARQQLLEGVRQLSRAVKSTLGPVGRNVLLQNHGAPRALPRTASPSARKSS
jgi:chaperonin GroEL